MQASFVFNNSFPSPFIKYFKCFSKSISAEAEAFINKRTFFSTIEKGKIIEVPNKFDSCIFLIKNGIVQKYQKEKNGIETILLFASECELLEWNRIQYKRKIKTIEYTELCGLNYFELSNVPLTKDFRIIKNIVKSKVNGDKEKRESIAQMEIYKDRYMIFFKEMGKLIFERVPAELIASYLAIPMNEYLLLQGA